jgi:hypothetical protein
MEEGVELVDFHVGAKWQAACGKCGLGKVANIDWHEISAFEIKNTTIRPGSKNTRVRIKESNTGVRGV